MKIRIKFSKKGAMKFIGHLDVMRYFQKSMGRARVDIAYSEGFSPHQIMSFAAPLGVGLESEGEYLDIRVNTAPPADELMIRLNAVMVEGMEILSVRKLPDGVKNAMASLEAASYLALFPQGYVFPLSAQELAGKVFAFLNQREISVLKKTKRSEAVTDIRPMIHEFAPVYGEERIPLGFRLLLSQGSAANLKPKPVCHAFYDFCSLPLPEREFSLKRLDLYEKTEEGFSPLSEAGEDY